MLQKNKDRFYTLLGINFFISFIIACILWGLFFDRPFNIFSFSGILHIDFFNTLCGIFTVIGFIIAIYQIAELRNEKEIEAAAVDKTTTKHFKDDSIPKITTLKERLIKLQKRAINDKYSEEIINLYMIDFVDSVNVLDEISIHQDSLTCSPIIDCQNCLILIQGIINDLDKANIEEFKKHNFITNIAKIIKCLSDCERKLKA